MSQTRNPLRINVGFLINQAVGTSRDIHLDLPDERLSKDFEVQDLRGVVRFTRTPQGMLAQANFTAQVGLECVRCLEAYRHSLRAEFSELFAFNKKGVTESNLILSEDANIDLTPLLREYLLLEVPIRPICKPDCRGLCLVCGQDLNQQDCGHNAVVSF